MKFELEFDKEIYRKQMDLLFNLAWKEKVVYYKNAHFLGLIFLIIGFTLIFDRPSFFGFIFVVFGLGTLIPYLFFYFKIKSTYKEIEKVKIEGIEANENLTIHIWEFTEDALIINYKGTESMFYWEKFKTFLVRENNLFLITEKYEPIILGEIEVGTESFKKIIDFVEKRIVI